MKWEREKLQSDESGRKIMDAFNDAYATKGGFRNDGVVYSEHLKVIAEALIRDKDILYLMQDLREVEKKVRNLAAHAMVSISDDEVRERSGFTSIEIMSKIRKMCRYAGLNVKNDQWNDYDRMNNVIIEKIENAKYKKV